jgi:tRNA modification GTPase
VRLSGQESISIALRLFRPLAASPAGAAPAGESATAGEIEPGRTLFGRFATLDGEIIDHGYLVCFRRPRSFTGEDSAELWAHGSPAVLRWIVETAVAAGARPATPGEFTLRAFLNGRIDATQAEAIRDLIEARTAFQAKVAHDQVEGRISGEVDRLKDRLAEILAGLEAAIEFSEEEDADRFLPAEGAGAQLQALRHDLETLAGTYMRGRRVRDGARVAIIGSPNVGKSSLFNRLLEEDRAIVMPRAGTTRDLLEEDLHLEGIPATLIDTAGLHRPDDAAHAEAVRRTRRLMGTADFFIIVLDWSRPRNDEELAILSDLDPGRALVVFNKSDLSCGVGWDHVLYLRKRSDALAISALTGEGIGDLRGRLSEAVTGGRIASREDMFITNVRHHDLLRRSAEALRRVEGAARDRVGDEYLVVDLKRALDLLGEITGEVGVDGIYERIFKNFCIGK